jgi:hypothetical protein
MIQCATCPKQMKVSKRGLCGACHLAVLRREKQLYVWTPEMDEEFRRIYGTAKSKAALGDSIRQFGERHKLPRYAMQNRATALRIRYSPHREWAAEEIARLREWSGSVPTAEMGRRLKRSHSAVINRLFLLCLEGRVTEGYTQRELGGMFGVNQHTVGRWVRKGWLEVKHERITAESVEVFVWEHMDAYRFASCEEWWLKMMLRPRSVRVEEREAA